MSSTAATGMRSCPLCGSADAETSWLGTTTYLDREFRYVRCTPCGTLYCSPMPDPETVAVMYGPAYKREIEDGEKAEEIARVVAYLQGCRRGTFVDYGCGDGALLREASCLGWRAVGIEFDANVARDVAERVGVAVLTPEQAAADPPEADVLHLGDVIEHLTDLDRQMPDILRLIVGGGLLIARGPLEANVSLFTAAIAAGRWLRRPVHSKMPPYHVLLATAKGQHAFFHRFGLCDIEYTLDEVAWPAPARLTFADLCNPRSVALFALRRSSQAISALRPARWGNRYFYVGRKPAAEG